jgi:hypothetical protein
MPRAPKPPTGERPPTDIDLATRYEHLMELLTVESRGIFNDLLKGLRGLLHDLQDAVGRISNNERVYGNVFQHVPQLAQDLGRWQTVLLALPNIAKPIKDPTEHFAVPQFHVKSLTNEPVITYTRSETTYQGYVRARYDAKVGPFWVGTQDNGEGWWNWWVALAEQGPAAGDHAIVEAGGAASEEAAKRSIMTEVLRQVRQIFDDLGRI